MRELHRMTKMEKKEVCGWGVNDGATGKEDLRDGFEWKLKSFEQFERELPWDSQACLESGRESTADVIRCFPMGLQKQGCDSLRLNFNNNNNNI